MSTNLLFNKLRHSIAGRTAKIPKDRLRPEYTFGPILQQFVDARAKAIESRKEPTEGDLKTLESVDKSLAMLNSNGWRKKYPPTERTLHPKSEPIYYYRLADATDRANRGEKKPFWRIFFSLEADGLKERVERGELDERIGLPRRKSASEDGTA